MSQRLEQEPRVYTRRQRRNTPLPRTRTTSEKSQMQQSYNQIEELLRIETTIEGQHMYQEIKPPVFSNLVTGDCSTTIASTTTRITLGNAQDDELLRGLRRLPHLRQFVRSLRQQNNGEGHNLNNDSSTMTTSTTPVTLGNEHDNSLLNGLRRLTHVRRLARSLRHDQTTITGNGPNADSSTTSAPVTTRVTLGNAHDDSVLNGSFALIDSCAKISKKFKTTTNCWRNPSNK